MTVEEIHDMVDGMSHLTFDYITMTCVAALISAVGLLADNAVLVVAAMLVSPMMGPILCLTFGAVIRKREMVRRYPAAPPWGSRAPRFRALH